MQPVRSKDHQQHLAPQFDLYSFLAHSEDTYPADNYFTQSTIHKKDSEKKGSTICPTDE